VASTNIEICNSALFLIGGEPITSLADDNKRAKLCNLRYEQIKRKMITSHPWNFATKRIELARLVEAPAFQWGFQFQLPSDCLRVLDIDNNEHGQYEFAIEGSKLLTNVDSVKIKYIANVSEGEMPPCFVEALSHELAANLAYSLTNNRELANDLFEKAKIEVSTARSFNGQEGNKNRYYADTFTTARY
jgi:hypothetical protein